MDISKVERQAPAEERRSEPPHCLRILLQDILCFFILLSVALLIVAAILCVADDISRLQHRRDLINGSQGVSSEETPKQVHRYLRPPTWIRFFSCQKHRRQQDAKLEQLQEPEQNKQQGQGERQDQGQGQGEGQHENLQDAKLEQLQEPEQNKQQGQGERQDQGQGQGGQHEKLAEQDRHQTIGPHIASTYEPNILPEQTRLQAGGDHAVKEAASNQLDLDY